MYTELVAIRDSLAAITGVVTCKIGVEKGISPADYPMIRLVPVRFTPGKPYNNRTSETQVYFGADIANSEGLENVYEVAVKEAGNTTALRLLDEVFEVSDAVWRAMGVIPQSGLEIRRKYARFDALKRFEITLGPDEEPPGCLCGDVIQGKVTPLDCDLFGESCTPLRPVGPCMVSSEGTCAAWYKYGGPGTRRASAPDA